jgi:hypothetical protein
MLHFRGESGCRAAPRFSGKQAAWWAGDAKLDLTTFNPRVNVRKGARPVRVQGAVFSIATSLH